MTTSLLENHARPLAGERMHVRAADGHRAAAAVRAWEGAEGVLALRHAVPVGDGLWLRYVDGEGNAWETRAEVVARGADERADEVDVALLVPFAAVPGRVAPRLPIDGRAVRVVSGRAAYVTTGIDLSPTGCRVALTGRQPPRLGEEVMVYGAFARPRAARIVRVVARSFGRSDVAIRFGA